MRALDYIDLRKKGNDDREQIAPEADRRVHVPRRHGEMINAVKLH